MNIEKVLETLNIKHNVKSFIESNETKLVKKTLYYKHIPSAILFLNHLNINGVELIDDGFKVKGTMIDLSRNAVFKVSYFKSVIRKKALLGFNEIWLYLEDVYDLKDYSKFGYLRGKYKLEEIKELDLYAKSLGVMLVPCIQTLGHMSQFLRWSSSSEFKDQHDVLLLSEETNKLIQAMLEFSKDAFSTNKIHIGMDETFGFSFGQHYKKHGYKDPETLFLSHLNNVYNMAKEKGFDEICMWSDMFFRHRSKVEYYYDTTIEFEDTFIEKLPKDITLVYWDYYNHKENIYDLMIKNHQKMNRKVIMASGTWIWTRLAYDREKTLNTATHAINASRKNNVEEIIFTQWNDDGAYCDYETSYLGLFDVTNVMVDQKLDINYLTQIGANNHEVLSEVSKISHLGYDPVMLLWDDLLLGVYLNNLVGFNDKLLIPLIKNTEIFADKIEEHDYAHYINLANLLKSKLQLRQALLEGYFKLKDFSKAKNLIEPFKKYLNRTVLSFETLWLERNKVFGLEVIQNRLYSQLRRIDHYEHIIDNYKKGDFIEYLEVEVSEEPYLSVKYLDIAFSSKS
ncbi:beta-N-acetylhexosaminidase [Acholeplasma laidlawii]|uniref:beta-N-acetylhexosaminidase n=1 Tax=Acholeplasma laidlawii TaxID=2148 RepID=UPI0021F77A3D|nr:beta-N-acetylhexosaminidase [Acholeplasma laidlawii]